MLKAHRQLDDVSFAGNAQLCRLNPLVCERLHGSALHFMLPTQGVQMRALSRSCVSSFGFSGTIAHVVLQRSASGGASYSPTPTTPLVLSRQTFRWQHRAAGSAAARMTSMYAGCWVAVTAPRPPAGVSPPWLLVRSRCASGTPLACAMAPVPTQRTPHGVAVLLASDDPAAPSLHGVQLALALTQQLASRSQPPRVLLLTCGTQLPVPTAARAASDAALGGVWGFARVLRLEHASLRARSLDVSRSASAATAIRLLVGAESGQAAETELTLGVSRCHAARLRACAAAPAPEHHAVQMCGTYAITGGLGGLGLRAAALVVERCARRVLLASRSGRVVRDGQGLDAQLRALGSCAEVIACDGADVDDTKALVSRGHPLSGALHAAGVSDKGLLAELEPRRVYWMYSAKAFGAWYLHCTSAAVPLEARVLFSSVGSGLGNVGQANYAAGNACLDAHALSWRASGVVACSLQWPLVGGAGMGADAFAALAF